MPAAKTSRKTPAAPAGQPAKQKKAQRTSPTESVRVEVWTRAAGRCQLCNEWLLESTQIGHYSYRRGEMAHIVGQSDDPRSPRTDSPLTKEQRENPDNFMLLCQPDHDTIDHKLGVGEFTIAKLHELKREQEAHMRHVTGLPRNKKTCVVRVFGTIRSNTVQLSRQECNETTLRHANPRFAQFYLDPRNEGTEIELTPLGNPEDHASLEIYWSAARTAIIKGIGKIQDAVKAGDITHLSIFPFARIPALVYFGFHLGNKVRVTLFERHRVAEEEWYWQPDAATLAFEWRRLQQGTQVDSVALIVNISGTIPIADLPSAFDQRFTVYELRPVGVTPVPGLIASQATLGAFRGCYRQFLGMLEQEHKSARQLHLFPSVPLSIGVAVGMDLMPNVHPELLVYDRCPSNFALALTVNS
ncbi:SAVED domain-containing protein [Hymenobacter jeollabukensis]|uniref:SAVED domain-containing protein n=1 Tax=Hymenobacter jeollabukensis TaxID=2025313 RepID=A0A5R8WIC8_9BACT|nr:SAVED domain-containing protein [Hymenobacter jeollabukensis]TLM87852.1 SAVED domain-containing protein [Hymenobacter jeollabukensis]